jgi:uncharacterized OB-fold protein
MTGLQQDGTATSAEPLTATFLAFLAKRELRIARLRSSGQFVDFAQLCHVRSPGDCDWVAASGRASLFSYAIYRRQYHPDFPVPYTVAAVVLEEGPLLISTIVSEQQQFSIDMPLMAAFDTTGRLIFKPTTERGTL